MAKVKKEYTILNLVRPPLIKHLQIILDKSNENYNISEDSPNPNTQKLYKRKGNNQLKRVRSVVRISRRSSEPQTVGSKPIGPVNHTGSNNSLCIIIEEGENYCLLN